MHELQSGNSGVINQATQNLFSRAIPALPVELSFPTKHLSRHVSIPSFHVPMEVCVNVIDNYEIKEKKQKNNTILGTSGIANNYHTDLSFWHIHIHFPRTRIHYYLTWYWLMVIFIGSTCATRNASQPLSSTVAREKSGLILMKSMRSLTPTPVSIQIILLYLMCT